MMNKKGNIFFIREILKSINILTSEACNLCGVGMFVDVILIYLLENWEEIASKLILKGSYGIAL